jgi:hypothetical protein
MARASWELWLAFSNTCHIAFQSENLKIGIDGEITDLMIRYKGMRLCTGFHSLACRKCGFLGAKSTMSSRRMEAWRSLLHPSKWMRSSHLTGGWVCPTSGQGMCTTATFLVPARNKTKNTWLSSLYEIGASLTPAHPHIYLFLQNNVLRPQFHLCVPFIG